MQITAGDYLLYRRCPRSLHRRLAGEAIPSFSGADDLYPVAPERDRVRSLARLRYPEGVVADLRSAEDTSSTLFDVSCAASIFTAVVDIRRPQKPSGTAAVLVREGTSIKESYLREAAFLDYCLRRCDDQPRNIFILHVDKSYERGARLDPQAFFIERDVTRRVHKLLPEIDHELETLADELSDDPTLVRYRDSLCSRPATCRLCSADVPDVDATHVSTLHRGGQLVRDLLEDGITSIPDIPEDRLVHRRQEIQRRAVIEGEPYIDANALESFLSTLEFPLCYLDFEATSTAIPPFPGVRPWEHIPYLYSLHREAPDDTLTHKAWMMEPGSDGRHEMAERLVEDCAGCGSVVVYSAGFERGILVRLAGLFPELGDELLAICDRIVDLLDPFSEFSFYHHEQRGKVSLKTVLPVLTPYDYSGQNVQDGYTANLMYRYLSEQADAQPSLTPRHRKLLADLVSYCAMDTMAMVHIVRELRGLAGNEPQSVQ